MKIIDSLGVALVIWTAAGCSTARTFAQKEGPTPVQPEAAAPSIWPNQTANQVPALIARAEESERLGQTGDARVAYEQVLRIDPHQAYVHHRLAIMADNDARFQEAEAHYQAALQTKPYDSDLLSDLGYSYYLQRRYEQADLVLRQALRYQPNHRKALYNLGALYGKQGDAATALALFRQASGGNEDEAQATLRHLAAADQASPRPGGLLQGGPVASTAPPASLPPPAASRNPFLAGLKTAEPPEPASAKKYPNEATRKVAEMMEKQRVGDQHLAGLRQKTHERMSAPTPRTGQAQYGPDALTPQQRQQQTLAYLHDRGTPPAEFNRKLSEIDAESRQAAAPNSYAVAGPSSGPVPNSALPPVSAGPSPNPASAPNWGAPPSSPLVTTSPAYNLDQLAPPLVRHEAAPASFAPANHSPPATYTAPPAYTPPAAHTADAGGWVYPGAGPAQAPPVSAPPAVAQGWPVQPAAAAPVAPSPNVTGVNPVLRPSGSVIPADAAWPAPLPARPTGNVVPASRWEAPAPPAHYSRGPEAATGWDNARVTAAQVGLNAGPGQLPSWNESSTQGAGSAPAWPVDASHVPSNTNAAPLPRWPGAPPTSSGTSGSLPAWPATGAMAVPAIPSAQAPVYGWNPGNSNGAAPNAGPATPAPWPAARDVNAQSLPAYDPHRAPQASYGRPGYEQSGSTTAPLPQITPRP